MSKLQRHFSRCLLASAGLLVVGASSAFAGDALSFAVLSAAPAGGGAVTCTNSVVSGSIGSSGAPASITQTNCTASRAVVPLVSADVLADFNSAYDKYANTSCTGSLNSQYTSTALTLTPGVYCNAEGVDFTDTTLTLDAQGDRNAVWIFKIGTGASGGALTGTNFSVATANAGQFLKVYWWVADAVTMTTPALQGTILAGAAITLTGAGDGAKPFKGNALARGAVTLTNMAVASDHPAGGANSRSRCNQGVGNGSEEGCDPGRSNANWPFGGSNDEAGGVPGSPGRKGGSRK